MPYGSVLPSYVFICPLPTPYPRLSSGTFMLAPASTEPRSCLPWNKCGTCYILR
jgi:hypothetical protein